jgi:hypothetical protein
MKPKLHALVFSLMSVSLTLCFCGQALAGDYWVDAKRGADVLVGGGTKLRPWRTIAFALFRVQPPSNPKVVHNIFLVGGMVYPISQTIQMKYHLRIVGVGVGESPPIIRGSTLLSSLVSFSSVTKFGRKDSVLKNLVLEGGRFGVVMGAAAGGQHRPSFISCEFRGAGEVEVLIQEIGKNPCEPRFEDCEFRGSKVGILTKVKAAGSIVRPEIDGCRFSGLSQGGFLGFEQSGGKADLGCLVRDSLFEGGVDGIHLEPGGNFANSRISIEGCAFSDCKEEGIEVHLRGPFDPKITIEDCSILNCGTGIMLGGQVPAGVYSFVLRRNLIGESKGNGVAVHLLRVGMGRILIQFQSEANLCLRNGLDGFEWAFPTDMDLFLDSFRDRSIGNRFRGIFFQGGKSTSTVRIRGGILAKNGRSGMQFFTVSKMTMRFMTMADNGWYGLFFLGSSFPKSWAFDHCIFANNKRADASIPRTFPISYSLFQNQVHFGKGNLNANPKLSRPSYHLLPGSPCIDAGTTLPLSVPIDFEGDPRQLAGKSAQKIYDMGADEFSPKGSAQVYGLAGFSRFGFRPRMGFQGSPQDVRIGKTLIVTLTRAVDSKDNKASFGILLLGSGEYGPRGFLGLKKVGAPGSLLWQTTQLFFPPKRIDLAGRTKISLAIPNSLSIVGVDLNAQWLVIQKAGNAGGFVTTEGLRVQVGK